LQETLGRVSADDKMLEDIRELAETLRSNLDKIAHHGRRADSIVKNMLLHSREGSGERRSADINAIVEDSLNLAYHGTRQRSPALRSSCTMTSTPAQERPNCIPKRSRGRCST
jgi:two-component system NtrC family sensor kinase